MALRRPARSSSAVSEVDSDIGLDVTSNVLPPNIRHLARCYLNELCIPVSTVPNFSALRSAARGDLVVPRTRLQLGNRAFYVAGPVAWNSLLRNPRRDIARKTLSSAHEMVSRAQEINFFLAMSLRGLCIVSHCTVVPHIINFQKHAQDISFLTFLFH